MWKSAASFARILQRAPSSEAPAAGIASRSLSTFSLFRNVVAAPLQSNKSGVSSFGQYNSGAQKGFLTAPSLTATSVRFVSARLPNHHTLAGIGFIHCDFNTGKKKPEQEVLKRFYRLDWGSWIRRIPGSQKRVWKMQRRVRRRHDYHVFVSKTYCKKFDKMVTAEYREPKYYVDDIYEHYHARHNSSHPYRSIHQIMTDNITFPELEPDLLERRRQEAIGAAKNAGLISS